MQETESSDDIVHCIQHVSDYVIAVFLITKFYVAQKNVPYITALNTIQLYLIMIKSLNKLKIGLIKLA